jgi:hypothetical protein
MQTPWHDLKRQKGIFNTPRKKVQGQTTNRQKRTERLKQYIINFLDKLIGWERDFAGAFTVIFKWVVIAGLSAFFICSVVVFGHWCVLMFVNSIPFAPWIKYVFWYSLGTGFLVGIFKASGLLKGLGRYET